MKINISRRNISIYSIYILGGFAILWYIFHISDDAIGADPYPNHDQFINQLVEVDRGKNDLISKKDILLKFCNTITDPKVIDGYIADAFVYQPSDSIFLYYLCGYMGYADRSRDTGMIAVLSGTKLDNIMDISTACASKKMEGCDIGFFLTSIHKQISNDLFNNKLAYEYGLKQPDNKKAIEDFSERYFTTRSGDESACGDLAGYYLSDTNISAGTRHCSHPQTYRIIAQLIKSAQTISQKSKTISLDKILDNISQNKCSDKKNIMAHQESIACRFTYDGSLVVGGLANDQQKFVNIVLNELQRYKIAMQYYTDRLNKNTYSTDYSKAINDTKYKNNMIASEKYNINRLLDISSKTTDKSINILQNISKYYPIHIGLTAYLEDLSRLRLELVRIYTPIDQLYYKLRNVQKID